MERRQTICTAFKHFKIEAAWYPLCIECNLNEMQIWAFSDGRNAFSAWSIWSRITSCFVVWEVNPFSWWFLNEPRCTLVEVWQNGMEWWVCVFSRKSCNASTVVMSRTRPWPVQWGVDAMNAMVASFPSFSLFRSIKRFCLASATLNEKMIVKT